MFEAIVLIITGFVMLFELRFIMQNSNADYYHPFTQTVVRITNPLVSLPIIRTRRIGSWNVAGLIVAAAISFVCWVPVSVMMGFPLLFGFAFALLALVKAMGYLIIALMLAQALTSWLPSTQNLSMFFAQLTYPLTAPIRRIIPPIGMIDISLMVFLFLLWAVNGVFMKMLFAVNPLLGSFWLTI